MATDHEPEKESKTTRFLGMTALLLWAALAGYMYAMAQKTYSVEDEGPLATLGNIAGF